MPLILVPRKNSGATGARSGYERTTVVLKAGREKSLERRHPWIFSGAIERITGAAPASGAVVAVATADGQFLAHAGYSPQSQIRARVWSFDPNETIDNAWFAARIDRSVARRGGLHTDRASRLVNAENDGLPGVIVDHYATTAVVQLLTAGAEAQRGAIVDALRVVGGVTCIYERSDAEVRSLEGLSPATGVLVGATPPAAIERMLERAVI